MNIQTAKNLKSGTKLIYTDRDKNIVNELVEVHPMQDEYETKEYIWVTGHCTPVHYSCLELAEYPPPSKKS